MRPLRARSRPVDLQRATHPSSGSKRPRRRYLGAVAALADLAGGDWPQKARQAALQLSGGAPQSGPSVALLIDILRIFSAIKDGRLPSRLLVAALNSLIERRWLELTKGKPMTVMKLAHHLHPYGIQPKTTRFGARLAKAYALEDFTDTFDRYVPKADLQALAADVARNEPAGFESLFPRPKVPLMANQTGPFLPLPLSQMDHGDEPGKAPGTSVHPSVRPEGTPEIPHSALVQKVRRTGMSIEPIPKKSKSLCRPCRREPAPRESIVPLPFT